MKIFLFLLLALPICAFAQESGVDKLAMRQTAFGRTIPQEKVFVHMDNTSYQLGDTIWFSAYTRRTDTGKPSDVSGVLYVELYGQEGYMIERKLIQMKEGHGSGFFALNNLIQYAGFYELRAYTRWQLNWGCYEHKHLSNINEFFDSKRQEKEYYRDYEKLYSRVFPVYDKPVIPGEYERDMTLRASRRVYKTDNEDRELNLSLFPEGGNLVSGLPCRVAFEATWDDGEWVDGCLVNGKDTVWTQNRGRGLFDFIPQNGRGQEIIFVARNGKVTKTKLPVPEQTGVALHMEQDDGCWVAQMTCSGNLDADSLGVCLMHEGRAVLNTRYKDVIKIEGEDLTESGVYQLTVFDNQGRIFADRLFFHRQKGGFLPTLSFEGVKDEYKPYESAALKIKMLENTPQKGSTGISVSVRDESVSDKLYDESNILTEMLLSSEIRGFIPQPGWYFEEDNEERRLALDLLMLTQGWRRFDWQSMALPGFWEITQPAEKAPILMGCVFKNVTADSGNVDEEEFNEEETLEDKLNDDGRNPNEDAGYKTKSPDTPQYTNNEEKDKSKDNAGYKRSINRQERKKQKELRVHSEIIALDAETSLSGESETKQRDFRIQLPPYYGNAVVFISVADTTKWKEGQTYTWVQAEPDNLETDYMFLPANRKLRRKIFVDPADYLARIIWPYPRFVKPFSYYQNHLAPAHNPKRNTEETNLNDETVMQEVTVKAQRNSLKKFNDAWPILAIDAEEAENMREDYGLSYMQIMVGDYGVGATNSGGGNAGEPTFETRFGYGRTRRMMMDKEIPKDSVYARKYLISDTFTMSPGEMMEYQGTGVWDTYVLYSDYSPRMEGSKFYYGSDEPKTKLVTYPFPDGSRRLTYRDRRYLLPGFAYPADFYHPDYSKHPLPEGQHDYRRTLYWNPNLQLDENGEATITFYNNSRTTRLSIEAEGQASDGTLLWGR